MTLVERAGQVMATLDEDMAAHVQDAAEGVGIDVRLGAELQEVSRARRRASTARSCPPTTSSWRPACARRRASRATPGLELGDSGALRVDDHQRCPGHDGVFAAGDCVESWHRVLERPMNVQLGTHANKQGRIAGANATGADLAFPGVIGTAASKICRYEVARTGITEREAADAGIEVRAATIKDRTRAGYYPGSGPIWVKLVVAPDGRLLGGQIVGVEGAAKRIDVLAACIWTGMAVDELELLDLSYAPPYSGVYDPILVAARAATKALSYDALAQIRSSSRGRSSAISSPRAPSRRTRGDAALLEVDAPAGEVVDDLGEVGLVADHEHALVGPGGGQELQRVGDVEAGGQRARARPARRRAPRRPARAVSRARTFGLVKARWTCDLQRGQRAAGDARLLAPAIGEAALGVGPGVVGLGLAVPQEPELLRHAPGRLPGVGARRRPAERRAVRRLPHQAPLAPAGVAPRSW